MKDVRKLYPLNAVNEFLIKVSVLFNSRLNEHAASPSVLPKTVLEKIKSSVEIGATLTVRKNHRHKIHCYEGWQQIKTAICEFGGKDVFMQVVPGTWSSVLPRMCRTAQT